VSSAETIGTSTTRTVSLVGNSSLSSHIGVVGYSHIRFHGGVFGTNTAVQGIGVHGRAPGAGVWGVGTGTGTGVVGYAGPTPPGIGVAGYSNGPNTVGVYAEANIGTALALSALGRSRFAGVIESTVSTGTAPFSVASTTEVANLNASRVGGRTVTQLAHVNTANLPSGVTLDSVQSGGATITFNGTNSPGTFTGANTWLVLSINGTLYKLPVWQANN
jgi:hypothetical protein